VFQPEDETGESKLVALMNTNNLVVLMILVYIFIILIDLFLFMLMDI
jgi:hypothetical protein